MPGLGSSRLRIKLSMRSMLGFEFEDKTTPFSVMGFVQSISVFVFQLIESKVMVQDPDIKTRKNYVFNYILITCTFGIFSLLIMLSFKYKKTKSPYD